MQRPMIRTGVASGPGTGDGAGVRNLSADLLEPASDRSPEPVVLFYATDMTVLARKPSG